MVLLFVWMAMFNAWIGVVDVIIRTQMGLWTVADGAKQPVMEESFSV